MATSSQNFALILKDLVLRGITLNYFVFKKIIHKELDLKEGLRVLDIGSGTGIISPLFSKCDYIGIDMDEKLVAFSRKKYPFLFKKMDAQKLNFTDDSFDIILVLGVIHHLNNDQSEKVLEGAKRVLGRRGIMLVVEAIPPIDRCNFMGHLLRRLDEGHNIRNIKEYESIFKKFFKINKLYKKRGGLVDYGVFVLTKS